MKLILTATVSMLLPWLACAEEASPETMKATHQAGAGKVADRQDELAADVQQLIIEQTAPQVIEMLGKVKQIMDETTDKLTTAETGGVTLAAETEVIEKVLEAAKEKQKQGGGGKAGGAMMDMLERMAGEKPDGDKPGKGKGKGDKPGDKPGNGTTGLSDAANGALAGETGGKSEARRVPKASGNTGHALPEEFKKALDAYNRGAEKKVK